MDKVRDFVRHDEAAHGRGSKDQPPAQPDPSPRRTASPAAASIPDRHRRRRDVSHKGIFTDLPGHYVERPALEEQLDSTRDGRLRSSDPKLAAGKRRTARSAFVPDYPHL